MSAHYIIGQDGEVVQMVRNNQIAYHAHNANTDSIFRWTGSPDYQFIYNLATAGNAQGTYGVQLTLYASNGTTILAQSLKQYFVLRN